eukprot:Rhum_TRINITY_DN14060_c0_g1::Rhum_TRINITY_DN14060_c0_g1_i1::g.68214::m.68214
MKSLLRGVAAARSVYESATAGTAASILVVPKHAAPAPQRRAFTGGAQPSDAVAAAAAATTTTTTEDDIVRSSFPAKDRIVTETTFHVDGHRRDGGGGGRSSDGDNGYHQRPKRGGDKPLSGGEANSVVRVRSDTKTASLSGWLTQRLRESKEPLTMTTIGMSGLNQMVKALAVSAELLREEGIVVCRAAKSDTVTERGSPAVYFAVTVTLRPPMDLSQYNVSPNRVGASSHPSAVLQIVESAQKIGHACVLSVAGPESIQKATVAITQLHRSTEFIASLVQNEEGEYTAIHLRILPLPGAAKVVFVSKYTKPAKLAGYIKHVFKEEGGSRAVKVVASIDSHEAVRAAAKACEIATDYLEQDRVPLTMEIELAEDDDALSSGSYVMTLTKELAKEATALRVTVGLGNLTVERVVDQIKAGVEAGRVVHLRGTLQGAPTVLEALTILGETCPVTFYSRPKDLTVGVKNEKLLSPQMDRFFIEFMVERQLIPTSIDCKPGCEALLRKAAKLHPTFTLNLRDVDRVQHAVRELATAAQFVAGSSLLRVAAEAWGIGMQFTVTREAWGEECGTQNRKVQRSLPYHSSFNACQQALLNFAQHGCFQVSVASKAQTAQLFRALSKTKLPFYIVPAQNSTKRGFTIHVPGAPPASGEKDATPDAAGAAASPEDELEEEAARVRREDEAAKLEKKAADAAAGDASA